MAKRKKKKKSIMQRLRGERGDYYDYNLVVSIILLVTFGLIMLYSASSYTAQIDFKDPAYYFKRQALISLAAFILALIFSQFDYHILVPFATFIFIVSEILLVLTEFIGTEILGAKRWIYIGKVSFQPAELAKLAMIIFIPVLITKFGRHMKRASCFWIILGIGLVTTIFTYKFTDNLSTAIIILGISVGFLYIVYPKLKSIILLGIVGAGCAIGLVRYVMLNLPTNSDDSFRLMRVAAWLYPERFHDESMQITQGLLAIGSGGFFGKGLGNSLQKLSFLPEAENDMIFPIICEELGMFGALMVTLLFVFMLYRLFFIAQNAPDYLGSLMAAGIFIHIALQVVLNMAVVTRTIPATGITLPFISYGGTSVLFLMMEMALALSISRQIKFSEQS